MSVLPVPAHLVYSLAGRRAFAVAVAECEFCAETHPADLVCPPLAVLEDVLRRELRDAVVAHLYPGRAEAAPAPTETAIPTQPKPMTHLRGPGHE